MIANLGSIGAILWLIFHVFTKLIPQQTATFTAALKDRDEMLEKAIKKLSEERSEENEKIVKAIKSVEQSLEAIRQEVEQQSRLLMLHDATMRNLANTGTTDTTTEDLAKAAGVPHEALVNAVRAAAKRATAGRPSIENSQEFASEIVNHIVLLAGAKS